MTDEHTEDAGGNPRRDLRADLFALLALRGLSLGGRFLFVIFAAKYMPPHAFGRFGLLAALVQIIPVIVGLEAHQILLRRILQEREKAADTRRFYATFIVTGSLVSGAAGAMTLAAFGWSTTEVVLGTIVLMLEQIGLETFRNLINERRPALSVLSVALRTGAWGVAVPALFFIGWVHAPWTFETVLYFWIVGAIGAILAGTPIWPLFRPNRGDFRLRHSVGLLRRVLQRSWTWVVFIASWRVIDAGGRFICAWMISEAAAGRFTFLSMLASLSYVAQKGVVEPIYYPRLSALDATERSYSEFRRINLAVIAGGILCSILGLAASAWLNGEIPPKSELVSFGLLCLAFAFLSLSQSAHYRLFRDHQDRAIMTTGMAGCLVMALSSFVATWWWGIAGAAAGTMLGALVLLVLKNRAAQDSLASGERSALADCADKLR